MSTLDLDGRLAEIAARPTTRRGVLAGAGGLVAAAALSRLPLDLAYGAPVQFSADPFGLGVATGDPAPRDVVLWTRLAPEPLKFFDGDRRGSMTARITRREMEVDWRMADVVARPDARVRTLRRFAVEAGRPGIAQT